jgi:L-asparagine permease
VPQWVLAFLALVVVLALNVVSVRVFGELEFCSRRSRWWRCQPSWESTYFVLFGTPVDGQPIGFSLISDSGGWLSNAAESCRFSA